MVATYYVKFGLKNHVGRFPSTQFHPLGSSVVVRSIRGMELGRVLAEVSELVESRTASTAPDAPRILRLAASADFALYEESKAKGAERFDRCLSVFDDPDSHVTPVDIEPLLDLNRVVLHYLGPHRLDVERFRVAIHKASGLDVVFEPVGRDAVEAPEEPPVDQGCGSGGCGSGNGGGCSTSSSSGESRGSCAGCAVQGLIAARKESVPASC